MGRPRRTTPSELAARPARGSPLLAEPSSRGRSPNSPTSPAADADFVQVAELYRDAADVDLVDLIAELAKSDAVPYLAAWRYKDSGLRKRAAWETHLGSAAREDAGEDVGKIPVPPKYASADFRSRDASGSCAGKLDVPKERFISYPGLGTRHRHHRRVRLGRLGPPRSRPRRSLPSINQRAHRARAGTPSGSTRSWPGCTSSSRGCGSGTTTSTPTSAKGSVTTSPTTSRRDRNATTSPPSDLTAWRPPAPRRRGRKKKA